MLEKRLPLILAALHMVVSGLLSHEHVLLERISGLESLLTFIIAPLGAALGTIFGAKTFEKYWWTVFVTGLMIVPAYLAYDSFIERAGASPLQLIWPCCLYGYLYFAAFNVIFCLEMVLKKATKSP